MHDCPACGHANPADARFCGQCGTPLAPRCASCGATLAAGQRFCTACGAPAPGSRASPAAGTAAPPTAVPAVTAAASAPAAAPMAASSAAAEACDADDAGSDGERRPATIVFSDLSGYTALNERVDPEEVSAVMAELRRVATAVIEAHGGIVNQIVGDEVMALFGVPQAGRDDARRALRATLALHRAMQAIADRHAARLGVRLQLHSGVNSGLVVVRPCAPHQGRFSLTGDAVNTAARLLKIAQGGEIVAGDGTWRQVSGHFDAERLPEAAVRGKALPVRPWRIVREVESAPAAPLVGRDDEMALARSALRSCLAGGARWIVIRGEPGIGKSRLLAELIDEARRAGASVAAGAVPDFGPARGAAAWRELMHALLGLPMAADDDAVDRAPGSAALPAALEPHLRALLGRPIAGPAASAYAALDDTARDRGALDAAIALVRARTDAAPLVLAIEDLHWAEVPALQRLARLAAGCRDRRLLVAVTTRPQSEAFDAARRAFAAALPALTVDLGPLGDADAGALARALAGGEPDLVARCVERAGGNPLFLEQLLRAAGEALRDALPGSIQALVLARLDRLAPDAKAALQAAAVLGQRFAVDAWRALAEAPRIEPLVEAGLLRPDDGAVQFVHALIRDGAYASLLKARRRELHLRAAAWFEPRDPGLRAEHLELAESALAPAAFAEAARAEAQRFRFGDALALAGRGLALARDDAARHALAMLQGEMLRELGRNADALAAFERARDLAGGDVACAQAWFAMATVQRLLARGDDARRSLDAALPVAERIGDARWLSRIHYLRGNLAFAGGDVAGCASEHRRALALANECGDALAQAEALSGLGDAHYAAGRMHSALDAFERCVAACERAGALRFAVMNRAMVGWCCYWNGRADDCRRELAAAGDAADALAHRNAKAMVVESLGLMLGWMGDAGAEALLRQAIGLSQDVGMKRFELVSRAGLASVLRRAGRRDEALAEAQRAWTQCVEVGAQGFSGPLILTELACLADDAAEGDGHLAQAEAILARGAIAHNALWVHPEAIWLRLAQGRHDEVLRHADALEAFARDEPIVWATHHVAAARALVRSARDPGDAALRDRLVDLLAEARANALAQSAAVLVQAIGALDARRR